MHCALNYEARKLSKETTVRQQTAQRQEQRTEGQVGEEEEYAGQGEARDKQQQNKPLKLQVKRISKWQLHLAVAGTANERTREEQTEQTRDHHNCNMQRAVSATAASHSLG